MLYSAEGLEDSIIQATDGEIGSVTDVLFDDDQWTIRYLVVDTGNWLTGRHVLVSPASIRGVNGREHRVLVELTREQIKNSPDVESDQPVSRLKEIEMAEHYRWPFYWAGPNLWGAGIYPYAVGTLPPPPTPLPRDELLNRAEDVVAVAAEESHLRSVNEVTSYAIAAHDGEIGNAKDFLINRETWRVEELVIDTTNWLPGGEVRVSTSVIESVDWARRQVHVNLTRDQIKQSTPFDNAIITS